MSQPAKSELAEKQRVLTHATLQAAVLCGLTNADLAKVIGSSPASIHRMRAGERLLVQDSPEWQLSALLVRLCRGLGAIMAGDDQALKQWMNTYNLGLRDTPKDLIKTITGLVETVEYVDAHRAVV